MRLNFTLIVNYKKADTFDPNREISLPPNWEQSDNKDFMRRVGCRNTLQRAENIYFDLTNNYFEDIQQSRTGNARAIECKHVKEEATYKPARNRTSYAKVPEQDCDYDNFEQDKLPFTSELLLNANLEEDLQFLPLNDVAGNLNVESFIEHSSDEDKELFSFDNNLATKDLNKKNMDLPVLSGKLDKVNKKNFQKYSTNSKDSSPTILSSKGNISKDEGNKGKLKDTSNTLTRRRKLKGEKDSCKLISKSNQETYKTTKKRLNVKALIRKAQMTSCEGKQIINSKPTTNEKRKKSKSQDTGMNLALRKDVINKTILRSIRRFIMNKHRECSKEYFESKDHRSKWYFDSIINFSKQIVDHPDFETDKPLTLQIQYYLGSIIFPNLLVFENAEQ